MNILKLFLIMMLMTLFMQNSWAEDANDTFGNIKSDQVDITINDNTAPKITGPDDHTIEQDATEFIIWNIIEKNPDEYQVLRNWSLISSGTYQNREDIEISIDSSMLGTWNYTINAKDIAGNMASDHVIITVADNTPPIITGPADQKIAQNATRNIDWHIIENNPDQYIILVNGNQIGDPEPYQNDAQISFPINSSIQGISTYKLIANDTSGKFSSDEVIVTVISGLDVIPPIITGPEDQTIEQDTDYVLTWNIIEDNPYFYEIKKDGVSQENSKYTSGIDIDFPIYTDIVGNFTYYIEANDDAGNVASHQVDITIQQRGPPIITVPSDISVNKGSAGIVVNIFDLSPAYYWVLRNVTVTSQPNTYQSGDINIPIDTSTLGIWNYTIFANDTFGDVSSKQVKVNVIQPPTSSGGSGGSSSSGGGGGGTGEEHLNILMYEKNSQYVYKDEPVIYEFSKEGNIVTSFSFTGMKKAGKILAKIEMLNSTSSLVTADPPDHIYKNFNLWCGFEGWFSYLSVANPKLEFTVEKSWVSDNNIMPSSINLYKFNKDSWNEISTRMSDQDSSKYYFVSDLPIESMGPLAVSGKKDLSTSAKPGGSGMLLESLDSNIRSPDSEPVPTPVTWTGLWAQSVPGFRGCSVLIIIFTLYIFIRKQD